MQPSSSASEQERDLQVARGSVRDAGFEDIYQFDVLVLFLDSMLRWDVDVADFSSDFVTQPFAAIESALVQQRLFVSVDGALGRARERPKGVQDDSP